MTQSPLTRNIQGNGPTDILAYEASGGYLAARDNIGKADPADLLQLIKDSNLLGRGGAGFPTGMKWSFVPPADGNGHRYLVANADEMEPGTFKDRLIMENDPHQLIEGMLLSAYTLAADVGYIFIRAEYHLAIARIRSAISEAEQKCYLGDRILGSKYSFHLQVHISAGRYICGEETALLNSLEGKRATPRAKPPFPQVSGLWGRPTIVNNVETLCNIPHIVNHGANWFKSLGKGDNAGTKLFGASGRVKNPGCWELPMGTSIREILEVHAGGMQDGYMLKGFLPGGASTDFLTPDHLDLPMEYEAIQKAGSRMGTGLMVVLDDRACPVGMIANLEKFFARESCGFCTPCREGLPWVQGILDKIEAGHGQAADLEVLERQALFIGAIGNTHCAHAPGAMEPLVSGLKYFRSEFEQHIHDGRCPYAGES
ncbi:MAG: NADH-quinone oxidoreductase subunit NuoF [SAR86 cluster bacterium]|jgi:NADH-quinone oxidoreductase subunit F|uniref:NADH-quinone oxidoreductase subunit F n=1 Tax=SAR86 cluster bacterium TaxID=2030880 RepID=A0A972VWD6_9GAMM|nr:NADH-quinone oxidoreductase subunit NuoF [SAR86 cluster bacterium]